MQDEVVSLPVLDPIAMYRTFEYRYRGTRRFVEGAESDEDEDARENQIESPSQVVPQPAVISDQIEQPKESKGA